MKSVLVVDTPDKCMECPVNKCQEWKDIDHRPDTCPLRPLPQRIPQNVYCFEGYEPGKAAGFNWCLDMIMGENKNLQE